MGQWFETGFSGADRVKREQEEGFGPDRFWVSKSREEGGKIVGPKEFVFVDDEPTCMWEHNPKINNSFKTILTCLRGVEDETPCCEKLIRPNGESARYYVGYFTVVDCSSWTGKDGKVHQYEMRFFPAKTGTILKLRMNRVERGSLASILWKAKRSPGEKVPRVGDEFEYVKQVDIAKLFSVASYRGRKISDIFAEANANPTKEVGTKDDGSPLTLLDRVKGLFQVHLDENGKILPEIVPFNYERLLRPLSPDQMKKRLMGVKVDADDLDDKSSDGNSVPF